jgi:hypothetical protein
MGNYLCTVDAIRCSVGLPFQRKAVCSLMREITRHGLVITRSGYLQIGTLRGSVK